jgi:hypothetical protein
VDGFINWVNWHGNPNCSLFVLNLRFICPMSSLVWGDVDWRLASDHDGTKSDVSGDKVFIGLAGFHALRRIWLES